MRFILTGWLLATAAYLTTYILAMLLYRVIFTTPADHNTTAAGLFVGTFLLILPYTMIGLYARKKEASQRRKAVLWLTIPLALAEKLLIFSFGYLLLKSGGDGSVEGITTMGFLQGDCGLPYFTVLYMLCSLGSVGISSMIALSNRVSLHLWLRSS